MRIVLCIVLDNQHDSFIIQLGSAKYSSGSFRVYVCIVHIATVNDTFKNVFINECFIPCQVYNIIISRIRIERPPHLSTGHEQNLCAIKLLNSFGFFWIFFPNHIMFIVRYLSVSHRWRTILNSAGENIVQQQTFIDQRKILFFISNFIYYI